MVKACIFDWGDTVMRDFKLEGPMSEWAEVAWIEGAQELLSALQNKYRCIIATSASHSDTYEMKKALHRVGAELYFDAFYSRTELGYTKPDPRFFLAVVEQSGLQPHECVMIGNSYALDIVGASVAGLKTILFQENPEKGHFPRATYVVHSLNDILGILDL